MKRITNICVLIIISTMFSGCLTPYDSEFQCQPGIIGKCTSSIVDTYKEVLKIDEEKEQQQ